MADKEKAVKDKEERASKARIRRLANKDARLRLDKNRKAEWVAALVSKFPNCKLASLPALRLIDKLYACLPVVCCLPAYIAEVLPILRRRDPERQPPLPQPEDVLAMCIWVEQLGRAFQLPMEGGSGPPPLFTAYNLTGQRDLFMDNRNIPKVIQTLVDARQSIKRFGKTWHHKLVTKFWKEVVAPAEPEVSLTDKAVLRLMAWELEWYPGDPNLEPGFSEVPKPNHTWKRRRQFWRMLVRCSQRMITMSSSLNWSTELEKEWLKSESDKLVEEMPTPPPPAKRRRFNVSRTTNEVEAAGTHPVEEEPGLLTTGELLVQASKQAGDLCDGHVGSQAARGINSPEESSDSEPAEAGQELPVEAARQELPVEVPGQELPVEVPGPAVAPAGQALLAEAGQELPVQAGQELPAEAGPGGYAGGGPGVNQDAAQNPRLRNRAPDNEADKEAAKVAFAGVQSLVELMGARQAELLQLKSHNVQLQLALAGEKDKVEAMQSLVELKEARQAELLLKLENHNVELDQHNTTLKLALAAEKDKVEATKQECEARLEVVLAAEKAKAEAMRTEHQSLLLKFEADLSASTAELADRVTELQVLKREVESVRLCTICFEQPRNAILLPCSHGQFCQGCAIKVFTKNKSCPTCGVKLTGFTQYFAF